MVLPFVLPDDAVLAALGRLVEPGVAIVDRAPSPDRPSLSGDLPGAGAEPPPVVVTWTAGERRGRALVRRLSGIPARSPERDEPAVPLAAGALVGVVEDGRLAALTDGAFTYVVTVLPQGVSFGERLRLLDDGRDLDREDGRRIAMLLLGLHAKLSLPALDTRDPLRRAVALALFAVDALPESRHAPLEPRRLSALERKLVSLRWQLRGRGARLVRTHGCFEPSWVYLEGGVAHAVPSLAGGLGDPAVDVAAFAAALIAHGLAEPLVWETGLRATWDAFWTAYLSGSGDYELLDVMPLFFASRLLLFAGPLRPSSLSVADRGRLLDLAERVASAPSFDPDEAASSVR